MAVETRAPKITEERPHGGRTKKAGAALTALVAVAAIAPFATGCSNSNTGPQVAYGTLDCRYKVNENGSVEKTGQPRHLIFDGHQGGADISRTWGAEITVLLNPPQEGQPFASIGAPSETSSSDGKIDMWAAVKYDAKEQKGKYAAGAGTLPENWDTAAAFAPANNSQILHTSEIPAGGQVSGQVVTSRFTNFMLNVNSANTIEAACSDSLNAPGKRITVPPQRYVVGAPMLSQ